jgi:Copper type II ascorbate-dependent monooxygenase, C-terminal domain/Copper type II ascorbate-dependent monooxygenase, N-terminal domain
VRVGGHPSEGDPFTNQQQNKGMRIFRTLDQNSQERNVKHVRTTAAVRLRSEKMSWRSACWGLAFVATVACAQQVASDEPGGGPLTATTGNPNSGNTPFPCLVGAALSRNCWQCHGPQLQYGAPMHLTNWEAVQANTKAEPIEPIYKRIGERIHDNRSPMPPAAACAPNGDCRPTPEEIQTLDAWIAQGAPSGTGCAPPPNMPPPGAGGTWTPPGAGGAGNVPNNVGGSGNVPYYGSGGSGNGGGGPMGTGGGFNPPPIQDGGIVKPPPVEDIPVAPNPDECTNLDFHARADASGAPFNVPPGEQYYCFSFHYQLEAGAQGLGFYKDIDNTNVIHHWLLYKMAGAQTDGVNTACVGTHPDGELIAGWAYGGGDWFLPSHVGMELGTGDFILEVHYNNTGAATTDKSGLHVCKAKTPRPDTASLSWLGVDSFPLGRGLAIPAGAQPNRYLADGVTPNPAFYVASSVCTPANQTAPIHILRSWPHMHKTGAHMRSSINRAGSTTPEVILDHDFSFNDQRQYETPTILNPGDTVTTECFYDNKTGASIAFGESTGQEMCYDFLVSYPAHSLIMAGDPLHSTACIPGI